MSIRVRILALAAIVILQVTACGGGGGEGCPRISANSQAWNQNGRYVMVGFEISDEDLLKGEPYVVFSLSSNLVVMADDFVVDRTVEANSSEAKRVREAIKDQLGSQLDSNTLDLLEQWQFTGVPSQHPDNALSKLPADYTRSMEEGRYYAALKIDVYGSPETLGDIDAFAVLFGDDCSYVKKLY